MRSIAVSLSSIAYSATGLTNAGGCAAPETD